MAYNEAYINQLFQPRDINLGKQYVKANRVSNYRETWDEDEFTIDCSVTGTITYSVHAKVSPTFWGWRYEGSCSCPRYFLAKRCKHLAAALLTHFDLEKHPERHRDCKVVRVAHTSSAARQLLDDMRVSEEPEDEAEAETTVSAVPARAVPVISMPDEGDSNFGLSVRVGYQKLYVVKDIGEFIKRVDSGENFSYGKYLNLNHTLSNFDEPSRKLIDFIRSTIYMFDMSAEAIQRMGYHNIAYGRDIPISPKVFAQHYDLLSTLPLVNSGGMSLRLMKEDPYVRAEFSRKDGLVYLNIRTEGGWKSCEGGLLCVKADAVTRPSPAFARNVAPLLKERDSELRFTYEDMPAFCSLVLPRIRNHVDIADPDGVLNDYMPDECVPRFYFDYKDGTLSCRLVFHYEAGDYPYGMQGETGRRDIRTEEAAARALQRDFAEDSRHNFFEQDEDRILAFLSGPIDAYRERGEVYISDRLKNKELPPPKAAVGVSVSDGMLLMSFDTGNFPADELEALYQSLLERRKYHRLKDGRFMRLNEDAAGIEALAETVHMSQLTPANLRKGKVSLPVYRALYLDSVLEKRTGMRVNRNEQFKELIRRFKTVEDSEYALPEGIQGELRPYQETGYRWLKTLESVGFGGILADEMGLGKTLQAITFFASRPRSATGLPHLVACPASLVLNWADEMARFAPRLKSKLIIGNLRERKELLAEADDADVWVTSYDLLKRDVELYEGHEFYSFVLDEGQFVKNQSTKASKAVKAVACRQRFVLTGTPVENRLSELWNLFDFLMPGYLFGHQRFVEKLEKPIVQRGDAEAGQQLNRMVRPFIMRRLKKDVLKELPDKIEHVRRIQLSESERKVYQAQSLAAIKQLGDGGEKLAILAALTRLRQICCDPNLCFENYKGETTKLDACLELVLSMAENGHQILLFSQFTSMLDRIRERLDAEGITSYTLQGSTPREERARLVKAFNQGDAQVFLISLKAGGTGLNLTAADVVIHYDPWWNIAAQNQATDRAHRMGQQNCVQVYKLIASDTVEERILDLQTKKAELLDSVTEGAGEDITRMSREDLLALIQDE